MQTSFKQLLAMLASFFVATLATLYLLSMFFPGQIVFGTHLYSPLQALIQTTFIFSIIVVAFTPVIEFLAKRYQIKLGDMHWLVLYFLINTAAIWFLARFAEVLGFGIASWMVAVVLGLILTADQGLIMKKYVSKIRG